MLYRQVRHRPPDGLGAEQRAVIVDPQPEAPGRRVDLQREVLPALLSDPGQQLGRQARAASRIIAAASKRE